MKLCVLVCTLDEARCIAARLENLDAQIRPHGVVPEIHVLDNGSVDATREIASAAKLPNETPVIVHKLPAEGKCASLFWAFQHVRADYFVLTDANTVFSPFTLTEMTNAMIGTDPPALIIGNTRSVRNTEEGKRFIESMSSLPFRMRAEQRLRMSTGANGACYAVSGKSMDGIWWLQPVRNDDFVISLYAKERGSVRFLPEARAYEVENFSLAQAWRQKYRDALGHHQAIMWIFRNLPHRGSRTAVFVRLLYWSSPLMLLVIGIVSFSWYFAAFCLLLVAASQRFRLSCTRISALVCGYAAGAFRSPAAKWRPSR